MSDGVCANRICCGTRARTECDHGACRLCSQHEVLIAKSGSSAGAIDRDNNDGYMKRVASLVGDHGGSGESVALHVGRLLPIDSQCCNNCDRNLALNLLMGNAGVGNCEIEMILTWGGGHPRDHSLVRLQLESRRKVAVYSAPSVGCGSTVRDEWEGEIFSSDDRLRRLDNNLERWRVVRQGWRLVKGKPSREREREDCNWVTESARCRLL